MRGVFNNLPLDFYAFSAYFRVLAKEHKKLYSKSRQTSCLPRTNNKLNMEDILRKPDLTGDMPFSQKPSRPTVTEEGFVSSDDRFVRLKNCEECGRRNQKHEFIQPEELEVAMFRYTVRCCNCGHTGTKVLIPEDNLGLESTLSDFSLQPAN